MELNENEKKAQTRLQFNDLQITSRMIGFIEGFKVAQFLKCDLQDVTEALKRVELDGEFMQTADPRTCFHRFMVEISEEVKGRLK
jgi:hypothetical protein